jgi:hypothetical protein
MNKIKKILLWIILAILVLVGAFILFWPNKALTTLMLTEGFDRFTDSTFGPDMTTFQMAGRTFKIPDEYVTKDLQANIVRVNYKYIWPDFTSARLATASKYSNAKNDGNIFSLRILTSTPLLFEQIKVKPSDVKKAVFLEKKYGLYHYQNFIALRGVDGLIQRGDSYILKNDYGLVTDSIHCSPSLSGVDDIDKWSCTNRFIFNDLYYSIVFNLRYLPIWQDIKQKNIEFLNQFEIKKE